MRQQLVAALQVLGVAALTAAGTLVSLPLGLAIAGVGLIVLGVALERG